MKPKNVIFSGSTKSKLNRLLAVCNNISIVDTTGILENLLQIILGTPTRFVEPSILEPGGIKFKSALGMYRIGGEEHKKDEIIVSKILTEWKCNIDDEDRKRLGILPKESDRVTLYVNRIMFNGYLVGVELSSIEYIERRIDIERPLLLVFGDKSESRDNITDEVLDKILALDNRSRIINIFDIPTRYNRQEGYSLMLDR